MERREGLWGEGGGGVRESGRVEIPDCTAAAVSPCHKVQMTFTEVIKAVLVMKANYVFTFHT